MELLSVGIAKSIWLFDINELNPTGKMIFPDALRWLGEKYSFQNFPSSVSDRGGGEKDKNAYVFKTGTFQVEDTGVLINFEIYNDGIIADTWASTETGDLFLEEVLRSAATRYSLTLRPNTIQKKLYVSELIVRMNAPFTKVNRGIEQFNVTLDQLFARHHLPPYQLTGLIFAQDTVATSYKPPGFVIERRIGVPFDDNRYWSKSPFTTTDHLNALQKLEEILIA